MTTTVPFGEARAQFRNLLCRAEYGGERITITRHGIPSAVLVPVRDLALLEAADVAPGDAVCAAFATVEVSATVDASLAVIWSVLTDPRRRIEWWASLVLDPYLDGEVLVDWEERTGRVVDYAPGDTIVMQFGGDGRAPEPPVEVRIEFADSTAGVTVRIRATGPGPDGTFWQERVDAWKTYAEELSRSSASSARSSAGSSSVQP